MAAVDLPPPPPAAIQQLPKLEAELRRTIEGLVTNAATADSTAKKGKPWKYQGEFARLEAEYSRLSLELREKVVVFNDSRQAILDYAAALEAFAQSRMPQTTIEDMIRRAQARVDEGRDWSHRAIVRVGLLAAVPPIATVC
jgi:hypothetical protein